MAISERMQNVNYRLLIYLLPFPIILFYTLPLAGCLSESPGIPNIFTLKLQDASNSSNASNSSDTSELRLGYFGLCIIGSSQRICQSTTGKGTEAILNTVKNTTIISTSESNRIAEMITIGLTLQSKHIVGLLSAAAVLFFISLFFIALLKRNFKAGAPAGNQVAVRRRNRLRQASFATLWLSVGFALASAVAIQQTTNALAYITRVEEASVTVSAGQSVIVLQWLALSLSVIFAVGIAGIFPREGGTIFSTGKGKGKAAGGGAPMGPPMMGGGPPGMPPPGGPPRGPMPPPPPM